jgi:spore maturation protein CgeB
MPTFSRFARETYRTGLYEGQDILAGCDNVDLVHLEPSKGFAFREKWVHRLANHDPSGRAACLNPGLRPVRLTRYYDLFMLVCSDFPDLLYSNVVQGWRDHCRTSVCWIEECWLRELPDRQYWLSVLNRFDHVIVGTSGTHKTLGEAIGRPCHEINVGVDTIRFSPYPNPPARVIDVYSIGRRWEKMHRCLLELAATKKIFYIYDTIDNAGQSKRSDYSQHRELYASIAKRSRFFTVAPAKMNTLEETGGQIALGYRYFEGASAGAVLLGQKPDCEAFRRYFDWPQAVIEIQPDGSDTVEVISRLSAEPERLREISCRNAEEALRRHDWVYRWKEILRLAGLKPSPEMEAREKRLGEMANLARESAR